MPINVHKGAVAKAGALLKATAVKVKQIFRRLKDPSQKSEVGFLNLPQEIRRKIYELYAADLLKSSYIRRTKARELRDDPHIAEYPALLLTCKKISNEGGRIVYRSAKILFREPEIGTLHERYITLIAAGRFRPSAVRNLKITWQCDYPVDRLTDEVPTILRDYQNVHRIRTVHLQVGFYKHESIPLDQQERCVLSLVRFFRTFMELRVLELSGQYPKTWIQEFEHYLGHVDVVRKQREAGNGIDGEEE